MDSGCQALNFFSFIREGHPFHSPIGQLRELLRESPQYAVIAERAQSGEATIHAEIKGVPTGAGGWRLERFYWCLQYEAEDGPLPFRACTVFHSANEGRREVYEFPADPYLTAAGPYFDRLRASSAQAPRQARVLRYVPLRRLTFRLSDAAAEAPAVIGKLKRASKLRESYERLAAVHRGVKQAGTSLVVAAPVQIDEARCVFYQEMLPGRNLADAIDNGNCEASLRRLGAVHCELHGLEVAGLPRWRFADYLQTLRDDIDWIAFFCPEHGPLLRAVGRTLEQRTPEVREEDFVFCHGDFVPSQLLAEAGRWAITDFDLSRRGDACQEMAKVMASFKYHLPVLRESFGIGRDGGASRMAKAEAAYLCGYEEGRGQTVDRERLLWFRTCAEIHYLSLMLKKDLFRPAAFECAMRLVERFGAQLS